jgi:uncharacterized protein DUF6644
MPQLKALFQWVDTFPSSTVIRESVLWFPLLLTIHVVSMCLFAGLVLMMDLRLLGVGNMRTPFSEVQRRLFPWQMVGITINAITGLALVYGQPMRYYANIFFWVKMVIMTLLAVNAAAFHVGTYQSVEQWDSKPVLPFGAKLAAIVSLALWPIVIAFGRLMAYNWFNPI